MNWTWADVQDVPQYVYDALIAYLNEDAARYASPVTPIMALTATLVADFSSFQTATKEATAAVGEFKDSAAELGPAADKGLAITKEQAAAVGGALREVGQAAIASGKQFIDAYTEGQDAINELNTALTNTGTKNVPAVIEAYTAMADKFQETTKYGDEAIIGITKTLTTMGKVGPEQMQLALDATTNLASALKIDLATAADMVAKSIAKGNEPVGKLKTLLGDVTEKGWSTEDMLKAINKKVDGAAQNEMKGYNSQVEQMENQMGEVNETVGKLLVENMSSLMGVFNKLPDGVKTFALSVAGIAPLLAPVVTGIAGLISALSATGLGAALSAAGTAIVAAVAAIGAIPIAIGLAVAAVVGLGVVIYKNWDSIKKWTMELYEGIKTWMVDKFMALVDKISGITSYIIGIFKSMYQTLVGSSIVPDLITGIGQEFGKLDAAMVDPVRDAAAKAAKSFASLTAPTLTAGTRAGGAGGTVINISMTGMLGANDPQTRQAISQVVGDALAQSMRGQRLLSSA